MRKQVTPYTYIDEKEQLDAFAKQHRDVEWLAFDTEFVGEKRYQTLLCLIQVGSEHGDFIIDPLVIKDLSPFLDILADPKVLKVTHAGENDYRLMAELFDLVPHNLFDTQVAAGFCGYRYPISYAKLLEAEIRKNVKKGYAVADWESRPIPSEQIQYALNDIIFLPELYQSLKKKLDERGRTDWVQQELLSWESENFFDRDPDKEILNSNMITSLGKKQQIFLLRVLRWRNETARKKNYSKEMVFSSKLLSPLVRSVPSGRKSLENNRRLSSNLIKKHGAMFVMFFDAPPQQEELELLARLPKVPDDNEEYELILEMLYLIVKYRCLKEGLSIQLVFPRGELNRMKLDPDYHSELMNTEWRKEFLGAEVLEWIQERSHLEINLGGGKVELKLK